MGVLLVILVYWLHLSVLVSELGVGSSALLLSSRCCRLRLSYRPEIGLQTYRSETDYQHVSCHVSGISKDSGDSAIEMLTDI